MTYRFLALMLAFAMGLAWAPVSTAQIGQPKAEQAAAPTDDELRAFAGIVKEVQRIADAYRPKLEAAQTVREQQKVELAASDEMSRAVTQEGMTVDRYKEILTKTMSDPEVAGKVKQHIKVGK